MRPSDREAGMNVGRILCWVGCFAISFGVPSLGAAQRLEADATVAAGTGFEFGAGQAMTVIQRTPIFADVAVRTWSDEDPRVALGGSLRVEGEGRTSVAVVPRAELQRPFLGEFLLRPGLGVPFFFAPFSMAGVEASVWVRTPTSMPFGLSVGVMIDAFFFGSDVPDDSVVLMVNGAVGIDLHL